MFNLVNYWDNNKEDKEFAIEMIRAVIDMNLRYCEEFVFSRHELAMELIDNFKFRFNKKEYKRFVSIISEYNNQSFPWKLNEYLKLGNYELKRKINVNNVT